MMNSQNDISSQTARQILLDAEKNGVTVEVYLKNLADEQSEICNKELTVKQSTINYDFTESRNWLKNNGGKYVGKWIVLDGKKLIGAGNSPIPLVEKARRKGVKIPFVQFIDDKSKPFMGGWL